MVRLISDDLKGGGGLGLHGDVARKAAFDLCRIVKDVSPVRIDSFKGTHRIAWIDPEGSLVVDGLNDFVKNRGGQDLMDLEGNVVSALKMRAGLSGDINQGGFSFISPDSKGAANAFDVFIESFATESGEALALTVEAAKKPALPEEILYRNLD